MKHCRIIILLLLGALLSSRATPEPFRGEGKLLARLSSTELGAYYGLQYLLSDADRIEYLSLPSRAERARWLDAFWMEVDPTPTTEENEARLEHESRVESARILFSKIQAPGWDDRGEILIRFGSPSSRSPIDGNVTTTGHSLGGELWYYRKLNMSMRFFTINRAGNCVYGYAERPQRLVGPAIRGGGGLRNRGPFEPAEMDYMADEDIRRMMERTRPYMTEELESKKGARAAANFKTYNERYAAIYSCDTEWERLPLYFDIASFRGGDWSDRIDVSFEIPARGLKIEKKDMKRSANVELRVLVRNEDMSKVASDSVDLAVSGDALASAPLLPAQIVLALEPGRYVVAIEARDKSSNRRAAFRTKVDFPAYTGSPSISDIQFASSIEETDANRRFVKGNLQVVPHPLRAYRIPHPVIFYFEIYGLGTDEEGVASYKVEYRIVPLEKRRWGPVLKEIPMTISSAFETSGYDTTQPQRLSIATDELWAGPFRLEVAVTDLRTLRTAERSATFSIVE